LISARTFFRSLPPADLALRVKAIEDSFSKVGITG
jgi:hypothetical protein